MQAFYFYLHINLQKEFYTTPLDYRQTLLTAVIRYSKRKDLSKEIAEKLAETFLRVISQKEQSMEMPVLKALLELSNQVDFSVDLKQRISSVATSVSSNSPFRDVRSAADTLARRLSVANLTLRSERTVERRLFSEGATTQLP